MNSVPDQYLARAGGTVHVWKGFSATLAWRMEGLKTYDLFGDSFGWRRPGTEMFIEPGFSFSQGPHTVSFNVPFGYYYNRHPNPYTGIAGDATFPRQIFLTSYSLRVGKRSASPASDQPPPRPARRHRSRTARSRRERTRPAAPLERPRGRPFRSLGVDARRPCEHAAPDGNRYPISRISMTADG